MKKYILSLFVLMAVINLSAQVIKQKTTSKKIDENIKFTKYSNNDSVIILNK